jgi:hypothetical protein
MRHWLIYYTNKFFDISIFEAYLIYMAFQELAVLLSVIIVQTDFYCKISGDGWECTLIF